MEMPRPSVIAALNFSGPWPDGFSRAFDLGISAGTARSWVQKGPHNKKMCDKKRFHTTSAKLVTLMRSFPPWPGLLRDIVPCTKGTYIPCPSDISKTDCGPTIRHGLGSSLARMNGPITSGHAQTVRAGRTHSWNTSLDMFTRRKSWETARNAAQDHVCKSIVKQPAISNWADISCSGPGTPGRHFENCHVPNGVLRFSCVVANPWSFQDSIPRASEIWCSPLRPPILSRSCLLLSCGRG